LFRCDFGKIVSAYSVVLLLDLAVNLWGPQTGSLHQGWNFLEAILETYAEIVVILIGYARMNGGEIGLRDAVQEGSRVFRPVVIAWFLMAVIVLIGLAVLVIPGLIALTLLFVVSPACVIERTGPIAALKRSNVLTKGHRWAVFGLVLVSDVVPVLLVAVFIVTIGRFEGHTAFELAVFVSQMAYAPFSTLVALAAYQALRTAKEGPVIEALSEVFA
jgi:uncharacterized membrane protein